MNTLQAIDDLKSYAEHSWGGLSESFEAAIYALEKQIPKKVISDGNDESDWVYCPCCKEILGINEAVYDAFYENDWKPVYCHKCGQSLTW